MEVTTYTVIAERGAGSVWVLQCAEHPGAISQTKRLDQAESLMREAIAWVAEVPESEVEIELCVELVPEAREELDRLKALREQLVKLQDESGELARKAARDLHDEGLTVRDIGTVLDVSYQRAHQLVSR